MRTLLRFLARFTPLVGARECRVPGWRTSQCDTARLERQDCAYHAACGGQGYWITWPSDGPVEVTLCEMPECRPRASAMVEHDWTYPEDCQHPDCQSAVDRPAASDGDA